MRAVTTVLLIVGFLLAACRQQPAEPTPILETPVATSTLAVTSVVGTPVAPEQPTPAPRGVLRVWVDESLLSAGVPPESDPLVQALAQFDSEQPEFTVDIARKAIEGPGGALAYLETGRGIAPSILPDVLLLSLTSLDAAVHSDVVMPLNPSALETRASALDPALIDDLLPVATALGTVDDTLYGLPLGLEHVYHAVYDRQVITGTFATTWDTFLRQPDTRFLLPVDAPAAGDLALQLYATGPEGFTTTGGRLDLQLGALTKVFTRLDLALTNGIIDERSLSLDALEAAWQLRDDGDATVLLVDAAALAYQEIDARRWAVAPLPGAEGVQVPLVKGWGLAITTPDPVQQTHAAALLTFLAESSAHTEWLATHELLPARESVLEEWQNAPYRVFVSNQLAVAAPFPGAVSAELHALISQKVYNVLNRLEPTLTAAQAVMQSLSQP